MRRAAMAAAVFLWVPQAHAQGPSPGGGALDALLAEVRLLRQAIERQSATAARAQLLVGRLTLQDQRAARARAALERIERDVASATQERSRTNIGVNELQRALDEAPDTKRRGHVETELRLNQARLKEQDQQLADLESRRALAQQALDAETARLEELESLLTQMDRAMEGPRR